MKPDPKIWKIARLLIEKQGAEGLDIARSRAVRRLEDGDYSSAVIWARVTEVTALLLDSPAEAPPAKPREPPLEELMRDSLTKTVLLADEQRSQDLERVVDAAKRRLRGEGK